MNKIITLLLAGVLSVSLCHAQDSGPVKFLEDDEVTRINPTPKLVRPMGLHPDNHRMLLQTFNADKSKCWLWLHNKSRNDKGVNDGRIYYTEIDTKNPTNIPAFSNYKGRKIVTANPNDAICWGASTDSKDRLIFAATRAYDRLDGTKPAPASDIYPISEIMVYNEYCEKIKSYVLSPDLIKEIYDQAGSPRYFAAYGDLAAGNGYLVWTGAHTSFVSGKSNYVPTGILVKLNIVNGQIGTRQYYDIGTMIGAKSDNTYVDAYSENQIFIQIRSSKIGIFDFTLNGGNGGFLDNFLINNGFEGQKIDAELEAGRAMNVSTLGFCYFQMRGHGTKPFRDIFIFPSGTPNYSEQFSGYDITNYRTVEGSDGTKLPDYSDCYYYAPGINPYAKQKVTAWPTIFCNFLYYIPHFTDKSRGYIVQLYLEKNNPYTGALGTNLSANTLRVYEIEIIPSKNVFKAPSAEMTAQSVVENDGLNITGLNLDTRFNMAPNAYAQATIAGYSGDLLEYTGDPANPYNDDAPVQTQKVADVKAFSFKDLKQPLTPAAGNGTFEFDKANAAKGPYKVKGYVHYKWYGQVNFQSPFFEKTFVPDYSSVDIVKANYKTIWVPGYPYYGGHTQSMLYMPIDFDPPTTETPVSHYDVWVTKGTERIKVAQIPGNYDFNNKKNVRESDKSQTPDNYPYVCLYEIQVDNDSEKDAIARQYNKVEVETVYASGNPKIQRTYNLEAMSGGLETGVEDVAGNTGLTIAPNPVNNVMNVSCSEGIGNIEIYSISGSLVKQIRGNGNVFESVLVDDLAKGTYLVKVNNAQVVKIVKR